MDRRQALGHGRSPVRADDARGEERGGSRTRRDRAVADDERPGVDAEDHGMSTHGPALRGRALLGHPVLRETRRGEHARRQPRERRTPPRRRGKGLRPHAGGPYALRARHERPPARDHPGSPVDLRRPRRRRPVLADGRALGEEALPRPRGPDRPRARVRGVRRGPERGRDRPRRLRGGPRADEEARVRVAVDAEGPPGRARRRDPVRLGRRRDLRDEARRRPDRRPRRGAAARRARARRARDRGSRRHGGPRSSRCPSRTRSRRRRTARTRRARSTAASSGARRHRRSSARSSSGRCSSGARNESYRPTDDAALHETYVGPVPIVPGDERNLKITKPEDLLIAASILRERGLPA